MPKVARPPVNIIIISAAEMRVVQFGTNWREPIATISR